MIKIGDSIPANKLTELSATGMDTYSLADMSVGKKVVVFGVPGAFTPTCSQKHLPGYVAQAEQLAGKGVSDVVCVSVNDAFVMGAWGASAGAAGKVRMFADGNGDFTKACGLDFDGSAFGMGLRCLRFAMVIEDGKVTLLNVEEGGDLTVSACEVVLGAI